MNDRHGLSWRDDIHKLRLWALIWIHERYPFKRHARMEAAISQISPSQGARYNRLQNRFRAIVLKNKKNLSTDHSSHFGTGKASTVSGHYLGLARNIAPSMTNNLASNNKSSFRSVL